MHSTVTRFQSGRPNDSAKSALHCCCGCTETFLYPRQLRELSYQSDCEARAEHPRVSFLNYTVDNLPMVELINRNLLTCHILSDLQTFADMAFEDVFVPAVAVAQDYVSGGVFPDISKKSYDELMATEKRVWDAAALGDLLLVSAWSDAGQNLNEYKKCVFVEFHRDFAMLTHCASGRLIPLHRASSNGHDNVAKYLLEHGSNAKAIDE